MRLARRAMETRQCKALSHVVAPQLHLGDVSGVFNIPLG